MAKVSLKHIYKVYDGGVKAVNDFNLEVEDKEFIVFVGPSGCGKSTTLRMVAGLEEITAGELWIGQRQCNHIEAKNRNISMVFQNYALFPNMTVYDNMAFGLKMHKTPKAEIDRRVKEAAEILGITEYLSRKPKALSGGQRQRVALGRAIVREPDVFLFDEPLSNLDAKLRAKMRTEITRLHKRLNSTFIYVTHDQVEAMTMGDRIVVMKGGYIQQTDTPQNLFNWPANKFVAGFIGTPQMNFFPVVLRRGGNGAVQAEAAGFTLTVPAEFAYRVDPAYLNGDRAVIMGVRPDHITPAAGEVQGCTIAAHVALVEQLGNQTLIYANTNADEVMLENSPTAFCASAGDNAGICAGQCVNFAVDLAKLHFFDAESEASIKRRVPDLCVSATVSGGKIQTLGGSAALPPALCHLAEGDYTISAPASCLTFGSGGFEGIVEETEDYNGCTLACVRCGSDHVFVVGKTPCERGQKVEVCLAMDGVSFIKDGSVVMAAVPTAFRLEGSFVRVREGKEKVHYIECGGVRMRPDNDFCQKMYNRGRRIFKMRLAFEMAPAALKFSPHGVPVTVKEIADYGSVRYAVTALGGNTLYIPAEGGITAGPAAVQPDFGGIRVYDSAIDMLLF